MFNIIGPEETDRQMWEMTLGEFLKVAVERYPDKVFVEFSNQKTSYLKFWCDSLSAAAMFQRMGVGKGDRVCLFLPNCIELLHCWFGLSLLGAICVPINTAYKRDEMAYILNDAAAKVLVAHHSMMTVADGAVAQAKGIQHKLKVGGSWALELGWISFSESMIPDSVPSSTPVLSPQDVSMLVYTSGTTGNPKGVQVTHQMYVAAGQGFAYWTNATVEDRFFTCLPYFHANAQYYSTIGAMAVGATLVVADRFSASRFWSQVRESRATIVNFIGMMLPVLAKQPLSVSDRQHDVRLMYGSPSFPSDFLRDFEVRCGVDILIGFALTECCYGTVERFRQDRREGSSGQPRIHPDPRFRNQIRIVDGAGKPLGARKAGEITLKNPAVTPGYWQNVEQTRQAIRNGWLYTGDLGWLDDEGFLYFLDRKKDVIRRRGENISSQQVEGVVKQHPAVLDCAVVAVPSELGEDDVKVYVLPHPESTITPEEIVYWCSERLAYFKVPRYVELRDDLPRTPSLRVRKDVLRQERSDLTQGCFDREKAGIRIR